MMTRLLCNSFNTPIQLDERTDACASTAKKVCKRYGKLTNFLATILKNINSEADDIIEYRKTTALLLEEVNDGYNAFKRCFPVSKKISTTA